MLVEFVFHLWPKNKLSHIHATIQTLAHITNSKSAHTHTLSQNEACVNFVDGMLNGTAVLKSEQKFTDKVGQKEGRQSVLH